MKKINQLEKKSNLGVGQMMNGLYKSIFINNVNTFPEIIHRYISLKALDRIKNLR